MLVDFPFRWSCCEQLKLESGAIPVVDVPVWYTLFPGTCCPKPSAIDLFRLHIAKRLSLNCNLPGLFGNDRIELAVKSQTTVNQIGKFRIIIPKMKFLDAGHTHREQTRKRIVSRCVHMNRTPGNYAGRLAILHDQLIYPLIVTVDLRTLVQPNEGSRSYLSGFPPSSAGGAKPCSKAAFEPGRGCVPFLGGSSATSSAAGSDDPSRLIRMLRYQTSLP